MSTVNQPDSEDLASLRRMLRTRKHTAARVGLSASALRALLGRMPPDATVWMSVNDLATLLVAGDETLGLGG